MVENINAVGEYRITIDDGGAEETFELKNRVMNAYLDGLVGLLKGDDDLQIKYLAVGDSSVALADTQTKLGNEVFRTQVTTQTLTATGTLETRFRIQASEGVGTINEIGVFAGSAATSVKDSGIMISRILWNKEKTNSMEIDFIRTDRLVRG